MNSLAYSTRYVVGFIFYEELQQVVLMKKTHPPEQAGKLNGVGGRVEIGESPVQAMVREALEECGVQTTKDNWRQFHYERRLTLTPDQPSRTTHLYFYACAASERHMNKVRTMTDEEVDVYHHDHRGQIGDFPMVHNLPWLIPMALDYLASPEHRYMEG